MLILYLPDQAGCSPLSHSQNMEKRGFFTFLPLVFISVEHYLLQWGAVWVHPPCYWAPAHPVRHCDGGRCFVVWGMGLGIWLADGPSTDYVTSLVVVWCLSFGGASLVAMLVRALSFVII